MNCYVIRSSSFAAKWKVKTWTKQSKTKKKQKRIHPKTNNSKNFCPEKKKNLLQKQKNCRSFLTKKHQANPISLLLSSQEEAGEVRHRQFLHLPVTDRFAILQNLWIPIMSRRVVVRWSDTLFESRFFPLVRFRITVTGNFFNLDSRFAGRRLRPVYMEVGVPRFKWGDPLR